MAELPVQIMRTNAMVRRYSMGCGFRLKTTGTLSVKPLRQRYVVKYHCFIFIFVGGSFPQRKRYSSYWLPSGGRVSKCTLSSARVCFDAQSLRTTTYEYSI